MERNGIIVPVGEKPIIDSNTLAAVTQFIAVSKPGEMETVKRVIISMLNRKGQIR